MKKTQTNKTSSSRRPIAIGPIALKKETIATLTHANTAITGAAAIWSGAFVCNSQSKEPTFCF